VSQRYRAPVTSLRRVAPVFVTTDLARALAHYQRLGFVVEAYDGADYYGYACRDGIEIHFAKVDSIDCATTTSCALPLSRRRSCPPQRVVRSRCGRSAGSAHLNGLRTR